jgi:transcriptional regulator with XRE-family HTH domain
MPTIDMKATGLNIKETITKKGMNIKDVAATLGFTTAYPVYKWVNGKNMPTLDNLVVLAAILETTIDNLIITKPV